MSTVFLSFTRREVRFQESGRWDHVVWDGTVRFISDLIDKLEAEYNIDPTRIYADGISNGGGMAFALSCRLSDRIAAVGAVAAAQTLPWNECGDPKPVPTVAFHGTADPFAPYQGGKSRDPFNQVMFPAIPDWTARVARRNQCKGDPIATRICELCRQCRRDSIYG